MNEEKDRFGDLMRLLERAREDIYFSEKDRELLGKLKARLAKDPNAQLESPLLACLRCHEELHTSILVGVLVSHCPACGGVWLDSGVVDEFLRDTRTPTQEWLIQRWKRKRAA